MAKTKITPPQPVITPVPPDEIKPVSVVPYEELIRGKVYVKDLAGSLYYLDPSKRQGEFVLRVVPRPLAAAEPLPSEWRRPEPTEEKIDWESAEEA